MALLCLLYVFVVFGIPRQPFEDVVDIDEVAISGRANLVENIAVSNEPIDNYLAFPIISAPASTRWLYREVAALAIP